MPGTHGDLAPILADELITWLRQLGTQGQFVQRAFTGVSQGAKQAVVILTGLGLDHLRRRAFLIWLCREEGFVAYAYASHVTVADNKSTLTEGVDISASSEHFDVEVSLRITRSADGKYFFDEESRVVSKVGSKEPSIFSSLHRSKSEISNQDQKMFRQIWDEVKPKVMWRQR
ncbi:MAG: hypothetical protein WA728_31110 [Xanthobacteraceae bacterium]